MAFLHRIPQSIVIRWLVALISVATIVGHTQAATRVDDFSDEQFVMSTSQPDSGPVVIKSAIPGTVTRTLAISSTGSDDSSEMFAGAGSLSISNDFGAASIARVIYEFNSVDVRAFGNAWLIDIADIDLQVTISLIANATSEFVFQPLTQAGQYMALFSAFTNPTVFGQLTRLELRVTSADNADMRLSNLGVARIPTPAAVPEPGVLALLTMGLLATASANRRTQTIRL